jgi:hypothetical protein
VECLEVRINGDLVKIRQDSLKISDAIEERSTADFIVIDDDNSLTFHKGQSVTVLDFGGVVNSTERKVLPNGTAFHVIRCIDNHYLSDKVIFTGAYQNTLAGYIVADIIIKKLSAEGVTIGEIQNGPTITEAVFNYAKVTDCLNSLAEQSGFWWRIDKDKKLYFVSRTTFEAPWVATKEDMKEGSISLKEGNPKYRNVQYVVGGTDITDPITESFVGDGERQTFTVGFTLAKVPIIALNGNLQTVGIRGLESGKDWYWSKVDSNISQDFIGTPLTSSDTLIINYQGQFPIVAIIIDDAQVTNRQTIEGNSGLVEDVEDTSKTTTSESAFELAQAKLDKYGVIGRRLKYLTRRTGLLPGQIQTVNLPDYGLNNSEMLIESIMTTTQGTITWYQITAIEGPEMGSWTQLFYQLALKTREFIIRENIREDQVLVIRAQFSKLWDEVESPNIFKITQLPFKLSNKLMFRRSDRVKYLSWYNGSMELGRKRITKQEGATGTKIKSTTFLGPRDANEEITHLGWWGGYQATDTLGTGFELDKQVYEKTKTELEALQVVKTDEKGW